MEYEFCVSSGLKSASQEVCSKLASDGPYSATILLDEKYTVIVVRNDGPDIAYFKPNCCGWQIDIKESGVFSLKVGEEVNMRKQGIEKYGFMSAGKAKIKVETV